MMDVDDIPEEAKLWLGAITVASWVVFVGGYILIDQLDRKAELTREAAERVLDGDYLLPFRPSTTDE